MATYSPCRRSFALVATLLAACGPDPLDPMTCDLATAQAVVYDDIGHPYYAGQAQLVASCTPCHHAGGTLADRYGAPLGRDWDLSLAGPDVRSTQRLREDLAGATRYREEIWARVGGGHMPPASYAGTAFDPAAHVADYHSADGVGLPSLRTDDGTAVLRNWLACGLPVVERTTLDPRPAGEAPIGDVLPCGPGACVRP